MNLNPKTWSLATVVLLIVVAFAGTIGIIYAYDQFSKEYTFTPDTLGFTVYSDSGFAQELSTATVDLGAISSSTTSLWVKNTGYATITVNLEATVSPTTAATVQCSQTVIPLGVGQSQVITINLTNVDEAGTMSLDFHLGA